MVRVIAIKKSTSSEGKDFISLKVQGGIEAIQSQTTGRMYLTSRAAYVPTTFDEAMAEELIGTSIQGTVKRVQSDPYEYTIKDTGEVVTLSHSFEYMPDDVVETKERAFDLYEKLG